MKTVARFTLTALLLLGAFSCNEDKNPTGDPMTGLLLDHCGGSPVNNATLQLWQEGVDNPGTFNDIAEALLETATTDSEGRFRFTEYPSDMNLTVRFNVPGLGMTALAYGSLDKADGLDLGALYSEGSETDVILTWTKDSTWTNEDTIHYSILTVDQVAFPPTTLYSTTPVILDTVENVPVYTKFFSATNADVDQKWRIGVSYTLVQGAGSTTLSQWGYLEGCSAAFQAFLVGVH